MDTPAPIGNPARDKIPDEHVRSHTAMTVPEENRRKTGTTDDTLNAPGATREARGPKEPAETREQGATGRTLREALEEAHVRPDDFEEK